MFKLQVVSTNITYNYFLKNNTFNFNKIYSAYFTNYYFFTLYIIDFNKLLIYLTHTISVKGLLSLVMTSYLY